MHDPLTRLDHVLATARFVDLTQPLGPETTLWPGERPFEAVTTVDYETHGAYARDLALPEHAGTHLDAPAHFAEGGATVDLLALEALVRPAVRLDVRELVGDDAAYVVSAAELEEIESRDGEIPSGSVALVHTGWDRFLHESDRYAGPGPAFPGLAADAARHLVRRGVTGIGIDTLGVDPGGSRTFSVHRITNPAGIWHAEGLIGLERLPLRGAWLAVGVIPVVGGSGAPARVFAIVP